MTKLIIVWTDGESETVDAIGWRKKNDYLWISLGTELMLVPLASVRKVVVAHERPKRVTEPYAPDTTTDDPTWYTVTGTGDWYPNAVIICGL